MNREDVAWLAGIIEGEGCFTHSGTTITVQLKMTDEDVVRRCQQIAGVGVFSVKGRSASTLPHYKQVFQWTSAGAEAMQVITLVRPFLGERRAARADELTEQYLDAHSLVCRQCGEEFFCEHANRFYCTEACRNRADHVKNGRARIARYETRLKEQHGI